MPLLDMPLEELKKYMGVNPKPQDFDQFWDDNLKILEGIDSEVELVESDFKVPFATCYHMYFTGVEGARIHSKLVVPNEPKGPAIVQFHGYTGSSREWNEMVSYAALGYVVAGMDCRGQGGLSQDIGYVEGATLFGFVIKGLDSGPNTMYYRHVFLDTVILTRIVMNRDDVDETRVGVMGNSQGGALTLACAALEPRVKKASPVFPFLSDYKRVWDMDLAVKAYAGITDYFRKFDPTHEREDEFFETLGYIDIQHLAKRIKGEVLMATGLMDNTCPPSSQFAAYNKIQAKKDVVIYPEYKHEPLKGFGDRQYQFFLDL